MRMEQNQAEARMHERRDRQPQREQHRTEDDDPDGAGAIGQRAEDGLGRAPYELTHGEREAYGDDAEPGGRIERGHEQAKRIAQPHGYGEYQGRGNHQAPVMAFCAHARFPDGMGSAASARSPLSMPGHLKCALPLLQSCDVARTRNRPRGSPIAHG
jgi:hypothetical protein